MPLHENLKGKNFKKHIFTIHKLKRQQRFATKLKGDTKRQINVAKLINKQKKDKNINDSIDFLTFKRIMLTCYESTFTNLNKNEYFFGYRGLIFTKEHQKPKYTKNKVIELIIKLLL